MHPRRGFTLVELLVSLALVGLLASVALPSYEMVSLRLKESELRSALRSIRTALDAYKAASDAGTIPKVAGGSGYPPSLDVLERGVEVGTPGAVTAEGTPDVRRLVFIRRVPRDPFHPDPTVPAISTWTTRAYGTPPDQPAPGPDIFDVASSSPRLGINGIPYAQW
jgi:general secretion pathway protein G